MDGLLPSVHFGEVGDRAERGPLEGSQLRARAERERDGPQREAARETSMNPGSGGRRHGSPLYGLGSKGGKVAAARQATASGGRPAPPRGRGAEEA